MKVVIFDVNGTLLNNVHCEPSQVVPLLEELLQLNIKPIAWSVDGDNALLRERLFTSYPGFFDGIYAKDPSSVNGGSLEVSPIWDPVAMFDDDHILLDVFGSLFPGIIIANDAQMLRKLKEVIATEWNRRLD